MIFSQRTWGWLSLLVNMVGCTQMSFLQYGNIFITLNNQNNHQNPKLNIDIDVHIYNHTYLLQAMLPQHDAVSSDDVCVPQRDFKRIDKVK